MLNLPEEIWTDADIQCKYISKYLNKYGMIYLKYDKHGERGKYEDQDFSSKEEYNLLRDLKEELEKEPYLEHVLFSMSLASTSNCAWHQYYVSYYLSLIIDIQELRLKYNMTMINKRHKKGEKYCIIQNID